MTPEFERPVTIQELVELNELEMAARGEPDVQGDVPSDRGGLEARVSALETEVKRLRELIENGRNHG